MANCIDYFATLGRAVGPLKCKNFEEEEGSGEYNIHPSTLWLDAITDINLQYEGEEIPINKGWEVIEESVNGAELPYPRLVYKRRKVSQSATHIIDICIVPPGLDVPKEFELILQSVSGAYTSYFFPTGYLAVRRTKTTAMSYIHGDRLLDDLVVMIVANDEEVPDKYERAPVVKTASSLQTMVKQMGMRTGQVPVEKMAIGFHFRPPVGLTNLRYVSKTLDRYPKHDNKSFPLPENELPLFAFPHDLSLNFESSNRYPLPHFFTFVFTDANGKHMYAACLHFYEKVLGDDVQEVFENVFGSDKVMSMLPGTNLFCPKVICVVSSKPYYRAMRRYLRQLYSMSLSQLPVPLENFVASLVSQVPLPVEGGRPFHVLLDGALISQTSRALKAIKFDLPPRKAFPHMDLDFAAPLRCLSVELTLAVFALLLREAKVAFMCTSGTLLTETMETLKGLLFPLTWSSTFVSRLPKALSGLLQAPGGFMVGLHVEKGQERSQEEKEREKKMTGNSSFSSPLNLGSPKRPKKELPVEFATWVDGMTVGTYVVDLNENAIFQYRGGSDAEQLEYREISALLDAFPTLPRKRLQGMLERVANDFSMGPSTSSLEQFDSAFDMKPQITAQENKSTVWEFFPTAELRDWFLVFMIDILGSYGPYVIPPEEAAGKSAFRTFQEQFRVSDYVNSLTEVKKRPFLEKLVETQMFSFFLQQRADGSSQGPAFFEEAAKLYRRFGLHLLGAGCCTSPSMDGVRNPTAGQLEMPVPLHRLLIAYTRLSNLPREKMVSFQPATPTNSPQTGRRSSALSFSISPSLRGRTESAEIRLDLTKASPDELLDLRATLKIREEMDEIEAVIQNAMNGGEDTYISRRSELDNHDDENSLNLQHEPYGPLIVPGPLRPEGKSDGSDVEDGETKRFTYGDWPTFDSNLLETANKGVHKMVRSLRKARTFAVEKVSPDLWILCRSPAERLSFCYSGALISFPRPQPMTGAGLLSPEANAVISSILDAYQSAVCRLCVRSLHKENPLADVLQILGIFAQIERIGLIEYVDELTWRAAILVCANIGGEFPRRISYALYGALKVYRSGGDCLSAGQYMRAIAADKEKKSKGVADKVATDLLDPYFFLEEMGYAWFMQRTYKRGEAGEESSRRRSLEPISNRASSAEKPSLLQSMIASTGYDRRSSIASPASTDTIDLTVTTDLTLLRKPTESANLIISQLNLSVGDGFLSCARPKELHWEVPPINTARMVTCNADDSEKAKARVLSRSLAARATEMREQGTTKIVPTIASQLLDAANDIDPENSFEGDGINEDHSSRKQKTKSMRFRQKLSEKALDSGNFTDDEGEEDDDDGDDDTDSSSGSDTDTSEALTNRASHSVDNRASLASLASPRSKAADVLSKEEADGSEEQPPIENSGDAISLENVSISYVETANEPVTQEIDAVAGPELEHQQEPEQEPATTSAEINTPESSAESAESSHPLYSVAEIQEKILDFHRAEVFSRRRMVGLHCRTPCKKCGMGLLEEEVLAHWSGHGIQKINANDRSRDIVAAHHVVCPNCKIEVTPLITAICYEIDEDATLKIIWTHSVPHLSPYGLRFITEELMEKSGRRSVDETRLYAMSPEAYWNTKWYASRLSLPTGFCSSVSDSDELAFGLQKHENICQHGPLTGPVIVGWAEHIVQARIRHLFASKGKRCELILTDVFPKCSAEEIDIMQSALLEMDGSNPGTKAALFLLAKVTSVFAEVEGNHKAAARILYETLLTVAYVGGSSLVRNKSDAAPANNHGGEILANLSRPCALDVNVYETIKCVLAASDFSHLHTTEEDFIGRLPTRAAMAFRAGFGLLL